MIIKGGRRYKVPSVTRITSIIDKSGPLIAWAINNTLDVCKGAISPGTEYGETYLEAVWQAAKSTSADIKRQAAERGKQRHEAIETSLRSIDGGEVSSPVSAWLQSISFETSCVERRVYSRRYRFSGTFDALGRSTAGLILIDWKTGKSIYPEYRLQTAAYVHAYEEEFPNQKIEGRYLVRIAEDGSVEPHFYPRSSLRRDFAAFLGALKLYTRVQQIERESKRNKL